ncbi:MAG: IS110 family transposase [Candidatus Methanoperedens sp.]|nr:IS110 family transposase [Candidatus Methanoperedens sp.]
MGSEGCLLFETLISLPKLAIIISRMHECVFERVWENDPFEDDNICPYQERNKMEKQKNIVCGADIHKKFIMATILSRDGNMIRGRFGMTLDEILRFEDWVINNNCETVAIESTGIYWIPIYTVLEGSIEVILANAYKVKHTPGKKTDKRDSKWLAELCLNGMIEPSRIFPKDDRELRALTRAREKLVNNSTQMKNRIHKELESACIKISSVLSDIFGKSGMKIINGLLEGKNIDEILKTITSKKILKKEQELRDAIKNGLDPARILMIRTYLELIKTIESKIETLNTEILNQMRRLKEDLEITLSISGMGFKSASTILAEIGNYKDFETGEQLASWCGLTPKVSQSADKLVTGSITKQGSKHVRRMLVQVAHAISRMRNSKLKRFFLRIQAKKGKKKAIVALTRKIICILHHILMNREKYQDGEVSKVKNVKLNWASSPVQMTEQDMISVLISAGYTVQKTKSMECI